MNELLRLKEITAYLRGENGCNWDKKQTSESLIPYLIEETYEVVDSIERKNSQSLKEELGDLLFNVYFQAQIADEQGQFTIEDVAKEVSDKLVRRHPHVFEKQSGIDAEEVLKNWNLIKEDEKKKKGTVPEFVLDIVPNALPALIKAEKLQSEAARYGFDWPDTDGILAKVKEELKELEDELSKLKDSQDNQKKVAEELGDLFFVLVNLARYCKLSSEVVLNSACSKFRKRFNYIEKTAKAEGKQLRELNLEEMDKLWNQAKELE